jgi:amino acid permease
MASETTPFTGAAADGGVALPKRNISWWLLAFLILGEIAGQGVFALPLHLGRLGWVLGTVTCFLTLGINYCSLQMMYGVHVRYPEVRSQTNAAELLLGGVGAVCVRVVVHMYLFTILAAYLNSLGRTIMNFMYETRVCLPIATAVALCLVLPFAQLRSYGDITAISLLSFAAVVACITLIMSESAHVAVPATASWSVWPPLGLADSLSSVGGFFFASGGGQCAFFEYLTELERPADYPKTLTLTTPILLGLYYGTAAIMYARFGDSVPGFLLDVLPFNYSRLLGNSLFFFHIIVSFTILNTALLRAYASYSVTDPSFAAKREWGLMSVLVLGLAYLLTNTVSVFEDLTAALGALFVSTTVLVIPPAYLLFASAKSAREDEEPVPGSPEKIGTGQVITITKGDKPAEKKEFRSPLKRRQKPEMTDPAKENYGAGAGAGAGRGGASVFSEDGAFETRHGSVSGLLRVILIACVGIACVAVPFLTWGAASRLLRDARNVAPPFACGPCGTRQCVLDNARGSIPAGGYGDEDAFVRSPMTRSSASPSLLARRTRRRA